MRAVAAITHLTDGDRAAFTDVHVYAAHAGNAYIDHQALYETGEDEPVRSYISMGANDDGVMPHGGYPSILISFVYDAGRRFFEEKLRYWPTNCMGDSGAFTVWTKGHTVDLDEYIGWCQHYAAVRPDFVFISLDVIPGTPDGAPPTKRERNKAMKQSLENGDRLRAAGVKIMEVFHWHEPISHLDALLARRQPGELVGVGGLAGAGSKPAKLRFIGGVFNHIRTPDWKDVVPLHGLGIAPDSELCYRFPWWSVDSSSWSIPGRFGQAVDTKGRKAGDDPRAKNRTVRRVYVGRVLDGWLERERALTAMWAQRGVTYSP